MARVRVVCLMLLVACMAGCCTDSNYDGLNSLWRQGYGFNNPNSARIAQGKSPFDF
jgi:hypothetical protein